MAVTNNGVKVKVKQGDMTDDISILGGNVTSADYDALKDIANASGEFAVIGYNASKRVSPVPTITAGTAGVKSNIYTLILERENAQTIYTKVLMPDDEVKAKAVGTAFLNKIIGGAKVINVTRKATNEKLS